MQCAIMFLTRSCSYNNYWCLTCYILTAFILLQHLNKIVHHLRGACVCVVNGEIGDNWCTKYKQMFVCWICNKHDSYAFVDSHRWICVTQTISTTCGYDCTISYSTFISWQCRLTFPVLSLLFPINSCWSLCKFIYLHRVRKWKSLLSYTLCTLVITSCRVLKR